MLVGPTFSAGTQSFHRQEKLLRPGLEILAEAGGRAGSPRVGHGQSQWGHPPLPSLSLRLIALTYLLSLPSASSSHSYTTNQTLY